MGRGGPVASGACFASATWVKENCDWQIYHRQQKSGRPFIIAWPHHVMFAELGLLTSATLGAERLVNPAGPAEDDTLTGVVLERHTLWCCSAELRTERRHRETTFVSRWHVDREWVPSGSLTCKSLWVDQLLRQHGVWQYSHAALSGSLTFSTEQVDQQSAPSGSLTCELVVSGLESVGYLLGL